MALALVAAPNVAQQGNLKKKLSFIGGVVRFLH